MPHKSTKIEFLFIGIPPYPRRYSLVNVEYAVGNRF